MHVLQRSIYYLSLWLGIVLFSFILFHAVPTDPARAVLGPNAGEEQVQSLRIRMGLDQPLPKQFTSYLTEVLQFNFGTSFVDNRSVQVEVGQKLKVTLALIAISLVMTLLYVGMTITFEAFNIAIIGRLLDFIWVSLPTMFSGLLIALLSAHYYPFTQFSGSLSRWTDLLFLLPPAFVLALYPMAILSRIIRDEIAKVRHSQFVLAARANGLSKRDVLYQHILRNAMIPMLAALANQIPMLFTSTFIIEIMFSIPGIGSLLISSLLQRDFPMLEGIVILNGLVVILVYMVFELLYPIIDPRIKSSNAE